MLCINCRRTLKNPMQRLYCSQQCKHDYFHKPKIVINPVQERWRQIDYNYKPTYNADMYNKLSGTLRIAYYHYLRGDFEMYEQACEKLSSDELEWLYNNV